MTDWIPVNKHLPQMDTSVAAIIEHFTPHLEYEIAICMISSKDKEKWIFCPPWCASGNYPIFCEKINSKVIKWAYLDIPIDLKLKQFSDI